MKKGRPANASLLREAQGDLFARSEAMAAPAAFPPVAPSRPPVAPPLVHTPQPLAAKVEAPAQPRLLSTVKPPPSTRLPVPPPLRV